MNLFLSSYTSIGSIQNTCPNPSLAYTINGHKAYKPAWLLADPTLERAGRMSSVNCRALTDPVKGHSLKSVNGDSLEALNGHAHKSSANYQQCT